MDVGTLVELFAFAFTVCERLRLVDGFAALNKDIDWDPGTALFVRDEITSGTRRGGCFGGAGTLLGFSLVDLACESCACDFVDGFGVRDRGSGFDEEPFSSVIIFGS
jgi:hypothetical protein